MAKVEILRLLGLVMRAGRLAVGEGRAEESLRGKRARLVMLAADASHNTSKKFHDKCAYYRVPLIILANKQELGACLGREFAVVAAVEDDGFAKRLSELSAADGGTR